MAGPAPQDTVCVPGVLGRGSVAHRPSWVEVQRRTAEVWGTWQVAYPACGQTTAAVAYSAGWAAQMGARWCRVCWPDGGA